MEGAGLIPFMDILKLVISEAKKVRDFKPLFQDLASTIERFEPIIKEIQLLQERAHTGNKDLNFLTKTMLRARNMVRECSCVRNYDALTKISYTKKIKGITDDFVKFCNMDLPLIQHRNQLLRSLALTNMEESRPQLEETSNISSGDEDEQRVIWDSFKDKGKGKQVEEDKQITLAIQLSLEELSLRQDEEFGLATQGSVISRWQERVAKRKLEEGEQIANGSSYTGAPLPGERILGESFNDNGNGKQVQEDRQIALALQESLNIEELSFREVEELRSAIQESVIFRLREQVAKRKLT